MKRLKELVFHLSQIIQWFVFKLFILQYLNKKKFIQILEKSFTDNPYPDPKKREELAKLCNSVRHSNDISDRDRVTEQIVTHWFQNKRKLTRRGNNLNPTNSIVILNKISYFELKYLKSQTSG